MSASTLCFSLPPARNFPFFLSSHCARKSLSAFVCAACANPKSRYFQHWQHSNFSCPFTLPNSHRVRYIYICITVTYNQSVSLTPSTHFKMGYLNPSFLSVAWYSWAIFWIKKWLQTCLKLNWLCIWRLIFILIVHCNKPSLPVGEKSPWKMG